MAEDDKLGRLIGLIYDAAVDPAPPDIVATHVMTLEGDRMIVRFSHVPT